MAYLKVGVPKTWDESKQHLGYIRRAGVRQFISTYNREKDIKGDNLLWGDEIEYGIFHMDHDGKKARIALRSKEVMDELNRREMWNNEQAGEDCTPEGCNFVPEYGAWMVEATPAMPYTGFTSDLLKVEQNMRLRRMRMLTALGDEEVAPTMATFPMLGALGDDGSVPATKVGGELTQSDYIGDEIINPHPRFRTMTANSRKRRGEKVNIQVPLFRDKHTPEFEDYEAPAGGEQLWRYGKGDAPETGDMVTMQKWLVNVEGEGCEGLFYRSSPNQVVPDADWPRNGDIVVGGEIPDVPGWIRLQNGYYLPMHSKNGKKQFLHKVSQRTNPSNSEMKRVGSGTPLFKTHDQEDQAKDIASLLEGKRAVATQAFETSKTASKAGESTENARPAIHMDSMAFGLGCCCLQTTLQAKDMDESRFMYDQLAVIAPIMMALTASTPFLKGRIADTDSRWGLISESVDDRTPAERGAKDSNSSYDDVLSGGGQRRLYKSRYDSISTYISQGAAFPSDEPNNPSGLKNRVLNTYNDIPLPIDMESYKELRKAGIDPALSQHVAHLFVRDPLIIFNDAVEELDDETMTGHWESIQSTNWQSVRWKPPPPRTSPDDPHIGWRTELRTMDMQLTDFENAAFTAFTVLLTRVILTFDLNLYIPLSRVDSNMQRAHKRNAASKEKFFFRRHMAPLEDVGDDLLCGAEYNSMFSKAVSNTKGSPSNPTVGGAYDEPSDEDGVSHHRRTAPFARGSAEENSFEEMTIAEIMGGRGDYFPGLIPLVQAYLDYINCDSTTRKRLNTYLDFIEKRATGELLTPATWMRNYVRSHPAYKGDSKLNDEIAYDLTQICTDIGLGKVHIPEMLGDVKIDPITKEGAYEVKLDSKPAKKGRIVELLQRYRKQDLKKVDNTTTPPRARDVIENGYQSDSKLPDEIDQLFTGVGLEKLQEEMLGGVFTKEGAAYDEVKLDSKRAQNDRVLELLQRYTTRDSFGSLR